MIVRDEFQYFASFSANWVATFSSTSASWQPGMFASKGKIRSSDGSISSRAERAEAGCSALARRSPMLKAAKVEFGRMPASSAGIPDPPDDGRPSRRVKLAYGPAHAFRADWGVRGTPRASVDRAGSEAGRGERQRLLEAGRRLVIGGGRCDAGACRAARIGAQCGRGGV